VRGRALVVHLDPERARTVRHHFDVGHGASVRGRGRRATPNRALVDITSITTVSVLWVWAIIVVTHFRFRARVRRGELPPHTFRLPGPSSRSCSRSHGDGSRQAARRELSFATVASRRAVRSPPSPIIVGDDASRRRRRPANSPPSAHHARAGCSRLILRARDCERL
jgi:hypothetical protein